MTFHLQGVTQSRPFTYRVSHKVYRTIHLQSVTNEYLVQISTQVPTQYSVFQEGSHNITYKFSDISYTGCPTVKE